jgi:hypothetical protein
MLFIKLLTLIGLMASIAWFITNPGFEPAIAIVGSISALVSEFVFERQRSSSLKQRQSISKFSSGIQAGGDVNIGNSKRDEDAE